MSEQSRLDAVLNKGKGSTAGEFDRIGSRAIPALESGYTSGGHLDVTENCNTNTVNGTKGWTKQPC